MTPQVVIGWLLLLIGVFAVTAGARGWKWIRRGRRIRWLVRLVGRVGTQVIYVLIGLVLALAGAALLVDGAVVY